MFIRSAPEVTNYTVYDVSDSLRQEGWLVPADRRAHQCPPWHSR